MRLSTLPVCLLVLFLCGCPNASRKSEGTRVVTPASKAEVVRFCADCHAYPEPDTFPAFMWKREVEQGFRFYTKSLRKDLEPPNLEAVIAYYESHAPEEMDIYVPENLGQQGPIKFTEQVLSNPDAAVPSVAHLNFRPGQSGQAASLFVCDIGAAEVSRLTFNSRKTSLKSLAGVPFPAHLDRVDLDGNGHEDWLISDLGSYEPTDDLVGELDWLQMSDAGENQNVQTLLQDVGRIADARAADFDGDGDQDLIVAIFGWRKAGKLIWLEQLPPISGELQFKEHLLDKRHGYSHVPLVDIDGDGDMDFIALISQEFESIELFENDGHGNFEKTILFAAENPAFGSSSIDLTDLDGDGDTDVLYTNGDNLDSHMLKPYHAVHWLENVDHFQFSHHHIANLPGAYCVKAGDMDGDGDLDLVASTTTMVFDYNFHTLVWFEQNDNKEFKMHSLESGFRQHACLELGDFDNDNDLDIAVGHFEPRQVKKADWVSIWWNDGTRENSE